MPGGRASQCKGASGERDLCRYIERAYALPFGTCRRNPYLQREGSGGGDVVGIDGVHIECKRVKAWRMSRWVEQVKKDTPDGFVGVLYVRIDGDPHWYEIVVVGTVRSYQLRLDAARRAAA